MSIQTELQAIYDEHGALTPALVVAQAEREDHPLHHRFTWDDSLAARRWRLFQASKLIRSVEVVIEASDTSGPIRVRAFVAQHELSRGEADDDGTTGEYLPVEQVAASDVLRSAWFAALERDWQRLKRRAGASREFAQMVLSDVRDMAG